MPLIHLPHGPGAVVKMMLRRILPILAFAWAVFWVSCRTAPLLPPADLRAPGWQVRQGQAVWKPAPTRVELAGDLLLATHLSGDCFIQFEKTPFALMTAQIAGERWQIILGSGERVRTGRNQPPERLVWFQLAGALAGKRLPSAWRFSGAATNLWRLENRETGESLQGCLFP